jgi:nucleoside-diphosphate-sugar epimerase
LRQKKLLFVGFGDIASRASNRFLADGWRVTGIARSQRTVPDWVTYWRGAVTDHHLAEPLVQEKFDAVVVTLTPDGQRESDYQRAYVETSEYLLNLWQAGTQAPRLVIFVSSSSVYHQNSGEWIDETSPAETASPSAQRLLEAEALWLYSPLNSCVLRFSGIYGPGRDFLLRQVAASKGGPRRDSPYTNRIHVDDCAGVIHHLCQRYWAGLPLEPLYLASDMEPAPTWQVRSWLAEQMGYPPGHLQETPPSGRAGSKRCSNARLLATGYQFQHPDYRSGYPALLAEFDA